MAKTEEEKAARKAAKKAAKAAAAAAEAASAEPSPKKEKKKKKEKKQKREAPDVEEPPAKKTKVEGDDKAARKAAKKAAKAAKKAKEEAEAAAGSAAEPEAPPLAEVSPAPATSPAPVDPQACKCFLGNLSYDITDDQVREFFKDCGEITDIHWLKDKESGEFYGSGFVEFGNGGAQEALKKAGEDFLGRPIKIDMAKPRAPRADGGGGFKKREPKPLSEKPEGCNTVFCGNLSYDIDDAAATKFFESCGEIANIRWLTDRETGDFKGCGFIEFSDPASVDQAVKKNGEDLMGRNIRIDYSAPRKPREKSW